MNQRLESLLQAMKRRALSDLLICDPFAIYYLIDATIEAGERFSCLHLNSNGQMWLYQNRLFPIELPDELQVEIVWYSDHEQPLTGLAASLSTRVGVDKKFLARFLLPLIEAAPESHFELASELVDLIRSRKDSAECEAMRLASHLNDTAMGRMYEVLGTGKTELEMVDVLRKAYRDLGCDQFSFEPIIAYGAHASDPHHQNRDSKPVRGDSIVVDMGCIKDGYCSDMTRTFFYGEPSERGREVYETVLAANLNAIATVRPGISHAEVDAAARSVIEAAGYGPYFTHRLGHGIGLECHEGGDVSQGNTDLIEVGEIFSIEPGIYLPGELGVRIEDLVLVTEDGCELLNKYPKDLMIVEATD